MVRVPFLFKMRLVKCHRYFLLKALYKLGERVLRRRNRSLFKFILELKASQRYRSFEQE